MEVGAVEEELPEAEAGPAESPAPRLASKVVVPSPASYDPRSLRQLRKDVADRLATKQAVAEEAQERGQEEAEGLIGAAVAVRGCREGRQRRARERGCLAGGA